MNLCGMNTVTENIIGVKECEINNSINHFYKVTFAKVIITITIAHSNEQNFFLFTWRMIKQANN